MPKVYNRAGMSTATTGTGTITLGSALTGYQSFADAGASDAETLVYLIEEGNSWELGTGTYTASGTTLSRTVSESSNSDAALNLTGTAQVFIVPRATELQELIDFKETFVLPTSDGTADQVLKTNGSGTLSFGTVGLLPISSTTISSAATVDIELPGGYAAYAFRFEHVTVQTDNVDFVFRTSTDGGSSFDSGASDYQWRLGAPDGTSGGVDGADVYAKILAGAGNASGESINGMMTLYVSDGTNYTSFVSETTFRTAAGNLQAMDSCGGRVSATAITDIQFLASSGNLVSGKIHLYGFAYGT